MIATLQTLATIKKSNCDGLQILIVKRNGLIKSVSAQKNFSKVTKTLEKQEEINRQKKSRSDDSLKRNSSNSSNSSNNSNNSNFSNNSNSSNISNITRTRQEIDCEIAEILLCGLCVFA